LTCLPTTAVCLDERSKQTDSN